MAFKVLLVAVIAFVAGFAIASSGITAFVRMKLRVAVRAGIISEGQAELADAIVVKALGEA